MQLNKYFQGLEQLQVLIIEEQREYLFVMMLQNNQHTSQHRDG